MIGSRRDVVLDCMFSASFLWHNAIGHAFLQVLVFLVLRSRKTRRAHELITRFRSTGRFEGMHELHLLRAAIILDDLHVDHESCLAASSITEHSFQCSRSEGLAGSFMYKMDICHKRLMFTTRVGSFFNSTASRLPSLSSPSPFLISFIYSFI
ncbi:hypothetical protein FA95DRAFT_518969 [Auriscalpium vulgare]|uniref:Uncharacterized protein n=1 Tax=Auriscalpium vulgare TaxID=40419 RepID=A0ACB8S344_9AGAM|nr:hypothetical protein FA95DRAFT_518969 [Auriscalpium vulgare]